MLILVTYCFYLTLSVVMTVWVARTLYRNGEVFLIDAFRGNEILASSINRLLVVGFYLINLGAVSLFLKISSPPVTAVQSAEALSWKMGIVMLFLGAFHFFNIYLFSRYRSRALEERYTVPVRATGKLDG